MNKLKQLIAEARVNEADDLQFIDINYTDGRKSSLSYGGRNQDTDLRVVGVMPHNATIVVDDQLVKDLQKALVYKKAHANSKASFRTHI